MEFESNSTICNRIEYLFYYLLTSLFQKAICYRLNFPQYIRRTANKSFIITEFINRWRNDLYIYPIFSLLKYI